MTDKPIRPDPAVEPTENNQEIDDFFHRLPSNFRWPKPTAAAIAAAVESIQRMPGGETSSSSEAANHCRGCGSVIAPDASFCVRCGLPKEVAETGTAVPPAGSGAQHHFHHHFHHFAPAQSTTPAAPAAEPEPPGARGRAPGPGGPAPGGRAELAARQVARDWVQACNKRHIDDLLELYGADATLIRSSVPPVRSLPAIREFLVAMLEAGLGDVEMESLRLEVMGEIAMDLGRCKMLVPVAMGKRREERGKYLLVLVRQPVGTWKILADFWSNDLPVASSAPESPKGKKPVA